MIDEVNVPGDPTCHRQGDHRVRKGGKGCMLPATGGIGVNVFYATGALLVIGGLFLAAMKGLSGK